MVDEINFFNGENLIRILFESDALSNRTCLIKTLLAFCNFLSETKK